MKQSNKVVPYPIIKFAAAGDPVAMAYIIAHFEKYIIRLASKPLLDMSTGQIYNYIDLDVKSQLRNKLEIAILGFKI